PIPLSAVPLPPAARVLIVMMSAVGDAVHVLPVVTALKRHDRSIHVTWVLQGGPASLVRGHPDVDEIIIHHPRGGLRAFAELRKALGGRGFDVVLDLQVYFKASIVTALADAPVKLGFDRARARDGNWLVTNRKIPPREPRHVQDQYFEFLDALGVPHEPVEWKLGPWPHEREAQRTFFEGFARPVATFVIGSTHAEKEWVPERWAALADVLWERHGVQPVLAGGRSARELETEREIMRLAKHPVDSTLGAPFRELVGILAGSALTVSLDTGPMHISVALGTPTIALMGYNNPKRVGPYRRFRDLLVDAYGDPGEDYPISIQKRPGRTRRITVEQVLEKVELWQRTYRR
ncbi:MAG TPA: glycosyltransferase family 9 protein, partial [Longimicrobium sp.]|nr:glycosyltransferase family 9 protein [Longimicrobium sp.]